MYKIKFTAMELNKFNLISNENIRKSLMSVYMYMLKLNNKKNKAYIDAQLSHLKETNKLNISFREFLALYNRNHTSLSIATFKDRIDKLISLGLISIEKAGKTFIYSFYRFFNINDNVNNKPNSVKPAQPIEDTNFEELYENHKYLNPERVKDLDSNSCPSTGDNFDYENYVEEQRKVCSWEYISNLLNKAFKLMKVRSSWIKGTVIDKVFKYYNNITAKHAMAYICTTIFNARNQHNTNYEKYIINNNSSSSNSTFNSFPQRNYAEDFQGGWSGLEAALLGWNENLE
jgi:hypothetical protein